MRVTRADSDRDRLTEPQEKSGANGMGVWALRVLGGGLLILLGFAIAIVGVLAGLISQGQLMALFTGADPDAIARTAAAQQVSTPLQEPAASGELPANPATEPRVLRDETYGDWRFVCVEAVAGAAANCSATQQLRIAESGAAVFVWRIVQDGRGGLVGVWQVPETVMLSAGLTLDAGTAQPIVMPFETCGGGSCQVVANLAPDFITTLSGAETLSASVVLSDNQRLTFPLSAEGIFEALSALTE